MFNWFKKEELAKIEELEDKLRDKEYEITEMQDNLAMIRSRLDDAIKIANSKRVVKCDNKRCIDWKDGTCELPVIDLRLNVTNGAVYCAEITESIAEELKEDQPIKFKFVTKDID